MQLRQAGKRLLAFIGQVDEHLTAIFFAALPTYQTEPDGAVDQPHNTVLAHLEPMGKFRDGSVVAVGEPFDGKQQLMLLRRNVFATGSLFAKSHEAAYGVAKSGDGFYVSLADHLVIRHCLVMRR